MSELTFEQMLEESFKTIRNGEVVDGTVIDVKPDEIILNIGYKADGIITRSEYTNEPNVDLTTIVSVGDTMTPFRQPQAQDLQRHPHHLPAGPYERPWRCGNRGSR